MNRGVNSKISQIQQKMQTILKQNLSVLFHKHKLIPKIIHIIILSYLYPSSYSVIPSYILIYTSNCPESILDYTQTLDDNRPSLAKGETYIIESNSLSTAFKVSYIWKARKQKFNVEDRLALKNFIKGSHLLTFSNTGNQRKIICSDQGFKNDFQNILQYYNNPSRLIIESLDIFSMLSKLAKRNIIQIIQSQNIFVILDKMEPSSLLFFGDDIALQFNNGWVFEGKQYTLWKKVREFNRKICWVRWNQKQIFEIEDCFIEEIKDSFHSNKIIYLLDRFNTTYY